MPDHRPNFITFERLSPGPVGSILVHDAEGEGWHWEPVRPPTNRFVHGASVALFGCLAAGLLSAFFYALFH